MTHFQNLLARHTKLTPEQAEVYLAQRGERLAKYAAIDLKHHPLPLASAPAEPPMVLVDDQFYRALPNYGPQGQVAFAYRFPQTAQDARTGNRRLSFANLFTWAGKARELSGIVANGGYQKMLHGLASNAMTAATSSYLVVILDTLPIRDDLIEIRCWSETVADLTCHIIFEWWRIPFPGHTAGTMFAWSRMQISSVEILGHGLVRARAWPKFFDDLLREMGPRHEGVTVEPTAVHDLGRELYAKPVGPTPGPHLYAQVFPTTYEDSNIVGNIYFANYGVWQARARDGWLATRWPDYARMFSGGGTELMCTHFAIEHLQEALPFDRIAVDVHLAKVFERGVQLHFIYYKLGEGDERHKLAVSEHTAQWVQYTPNGQAQAVPWPAPLWASIQPFINN